MLPINTNTTAISAFRALAANEGRANQSLEKLSTGLRINRGSDAPAGLIAGLNLSAVLKQLESETRASERASAVASTADAALSEISSRLSDAKALAVRAANTGAMSDAEREALQIEFDSIVQSVDRTASSARFLDTALLDGSLSLDVGGANLSLDSFLTSSLGATEIEGETRTLRDTLTGGVASLTSGNIGDAALILGNAITSVSTARGRIGAFQANALEVQQAANATAKENTLAARSLIMDTDFAAEAASLTRNRLLVESSTWSIGFADDIAASVLRLLD